MLIVVLGVLEEAQMHFVEVKSENIAGFMQGTLCAELPPADLPWRFPRHGRVC